MWENLVANDPDDGDVPKLLADDHLQDLSASSSVEFKLYWLLCPELLEELEFFRMAEAIAVTLAGSFSGISQHRNVQEV